MAVNISLPSLPSFASVPAQGFQINPSTIPSSCTNVWPGIHNLDASIVIGRSCAVFTSQGCSNSWDCTGVACNTLNSLCSTQFSTDFLQYIATGTVTGTTSISGYYPDSKNLGMTGSLVSASSYNPSWKYTAKPPCCGSCSLDGGTVQVYVWPSTDATKPSAIAAGAADKNQSATVTSSRNQTARTLVSDGFTLYDMLNSLRRRCLTLSVVLHR